MARCVRKHADLRRLLPLKSQFVLTGNVREAQSSRDGNRNLADAVVSATASGTVFPPRGERLLEGGKIFQF